MIEGTTPIPAVTEFSGWRKSNTSDDGACVYIADGPGGWVALRDSDDPSGAVVRIPRKSWDNMVLGIQNGSLAPAEM
ncbi:uncharacterized protein DUF397 [Kribbella orskensis]|uniref:Uncharacterized protein DUF397 n=1 Tax=Kribbella orskensis TaxID=2512216 RepID=A0ABY2BEV3_9ACTN|nr:MULTISPECIES: DUF397 domain-containing protein [Kribbella]TCN36867.1 uncharacterized protein DUF397 [Kribbella sp. VKM Ac-2500]TCO18291.1 uncharacterized protein DUF397 [Kribbella orskensis]